MMKILFIPSVQEGNGTGHLKRCCRYAMSDLYDSYVYIPDYALKNSSRNEGLLRILDPVIQKGKLVTELKGCWDIILTDMRDTPESIFSKSRKLSGITAGLDEGGFSRQDYSYLIDTMPNLFMKKQTNYFSTGLLDIKDRRNIPGKAETDSYKKILISFGGEDLAGLTVIFIEHALMYNLFSSSMEITVVTGPLFNDERLEKIKSMVPSNFTIVESPGSLEPYLYESGLVITLFGLTAYEALYHGCHVILFNPSEYHRQLSIEAGIPEAGILKPEIRFLKKAVSNPGQFNKKLIENLMPAENMEDILVSLGINDSSRCRLCGKEGKIRHRFKNKNYLYCSECRILFLQRFGFDMETVYDKNYFFEEYKKQYGRTYLEDFGYIGSVSRQRLDIIRNTKKTGSLLDVGCAYGPFLHTAKKSGFNCTGTDISEDAVEYVKKELGIDAVCSDFSNPDENCWRDIDSPHKDKKFDVITMWYVIEHFKNPGDIIDKVSDLLKPGGVFAFSTPSSRGISGIRNLKKYLSTSPGDHFTVWNPRSAAGILRKHRFRLVHVRITGYHPDRFPSFMMKFPGRYITDKISRFFKLGDTFEIYAVKAGSTGE